MKISVVINKEDERILCVEAFSRYNKTEEEIQEAIDKINNNPESRQRYEVFEVNDESTIGKAFTLLLGVRKYKYSRKLSDLIDKIEELKDELDCIDTDINDIYRSVDSLNFELKKLKENDE